MRLISVYFLFLLLSGVVCYGQTDSIQQPETTRTAPPMEPVRPKPRDTAARTRRISRVKTDSAVIIAAAGKKDSLRADSIRTDSLRKTAEENRSPVTDTTTYRKYSTHPALALNQPAVYRLTEYRKASPKDELFYLMIGVVFLLAFVKAGFPRYFKNLFVLFFQTNLRQKQTRDQLLQDNFASLLINVLFFITGGLYIALLVRQMGWTDFSFWLLAAAGAAVLLLVYLGKYLFLLFSGWVFNSREAAGSYIFMVFMVNKVMGVLLIPFLLLLAFADATVVKYAATVSMGLVALLFIYRYFVSFTAIRGRLRVNVFHFLLYLCSVEILPLLLIYKLLLNYFNGSL
ncbi:DUF4271 domain-containing protein [Sediminibacterium soli]|uniref:DUF4271 domain-containing protein n=1 Tax=Sediminibacterium soli TaxID=2698829 RepID=UPI0013797684|nr:DUF4271 domain-containing protein [Sediminibacterium soli]NCI45424.1 DUF4271 domain-containing protein [Sediminibacterium soli]